MGTTIRPGDAAPNSGQYAIVGPRGGLTNQERTAVRGKPMPPTPKAGQSYVLVDRTKNAAGRGSK